MPFKIERAGGEGKRYLWAVKFLREVLGRAAAMLPLSYYDATISKRICLINELFNRILNTDVHVFPMPNLPEGAFMSRVQSAVPSYRMVLLALAGILLAAIWGIQDIAGQSIAAAWLIRLVLGCLITTIAWFDSIKWKRPIPFFALWIVFFTWPIALPICCIRTRRFKGFLKAMALLGFMAVVHATALLCAWTLMERQAYRAHTAGDYEKAVRLYNRLIEYDAANEWASEGRASALKALENK